MTLQERWSRLEPRERRLAAAFLGVLALMLLIGGPVWVRLQLQAQRDANAELREAIDAVSYGRARYRGLLDQREAIIARYARKAPPLAAYLERLADDARLEIPESSDRPVAQHGPDIQERSTQIELKKLELFPLVKFMEAIARSPHPLTISRLSLRRRRGEPVQWDVELAVSAWDRTKEGEDPGVEVTEEPEPGSDDDDASDDAVSDDTNEDANEAAEPRVGDTVRGAASAASAAGAPSATPSPSTRRRVGGRVPRTPASRGAASAGPSATEETP